ncbi:hypothetical protein LA080_011311 [Diaporthe eres]|nr:hypothetical protein LA080_011311 [Diaporthe eres]
MSKSGILRSLPIGVYEADVQDRTLFSLSHGNSSLSWLFNYQTVQHYISSGLSPSLVVMSGSSRVIGGRAGGTRPDVVGPGSTEISQLTWLDFLFPTCRALQPWLRFSSIKLHASPYRSGRKLFSNPLPCGSRFDLIGAGIARSTRAKSTRRAQTHPLKGSTPFPRNMAFPVGKSWLENLPDERLIIVMKNLAPEDALKQHGHKFLAAYEKGISELLGLSLDSKRLEAVVRTVIYDKILICRSTDLILLLRTLTENRRTGEYIKNLVFYTAFLRQDPDHEYLDL